MSTSVDPRFSDIRSFDEGRLVKGVRLLASINLWTGLAAAGLWLAFGHLIFDWPAVIVICVALTWCTILGTVAMRWGAAILVNLLVLNWLGAKPEERAFLFTLKR